MKTRKIEKKTIISDVIDVPFCASIRVTLDDGTTRDFRLETTRGDMLCECTVNDEDSCEYEWHHYTKCEILELE